MQDKNIILTSLGGKKRGRKRKSKKTDSVLESFDLSSALSAPKAEFDTKKIQDVKDSETIDYTSKFDELKQVLETALSDRKKTPFTGFKKLDPRSIKKIDKFVIYSNKTIREAILLFEKTNGLPLIALNERKEFVGIISNGDIRRFLSKSENLLDDCVKKAINRNRYIVKKK